MFRSMLIQAKKPFNFSAFTSGFSTKPAIFYKLRDVNDVKIIGTLMSDSFTLPSGMKSITVRTQDSTLKHSNHTVHLKTEANFSAGQRIFLFGRLSSNQKTVAENKTITSSIIRGWQFYVMEKENGSTSSNGDKNSIEILGNIASQIIIKENDSSFGIATHFLKKDDQGEDTKATSFHRVFVFDEALRQYIENNLNTRDRVLVNGRIGHKTYTDADGKRKYSGFIVANEIHKVAKRAASEIKTNEGAELAAEI